MLLLIDREQGGIEYIWKAKRVRGHAIFGFNEIMEMAVKLKHFTEEQLEEILEYHRANS